MVDGGFFMGFLLRCKFLQLISALFIRWSFETVEIVGLGKKEKRTARFKIDSAF